jgi:hypothetical protein
MKRLRQRTPQVLQTEVCAGQTIASRIQKDHQIEVVVDVGLWGVKTTVSHLVALNMANLEATGVVPILGREMRG